MEYRLGWTFTFGSELAFLGGHKTHFNSIKDLEGRLLPKPHLAPSSHYLHEGTHIPGQRKPLFKTSYDNSELNSMFFWHNTYFLLQIPLAKNIYGLIAPNFGVGFAIGKSLEPCA